MARVNGKKADFVDPPPGYYLDYKDQILTLHFMLPFKTPLKAQELQIEIYDPSYFVDFSFEKENAVGLVGAPAACKMLVARPEEMDAGTAAKLFQMAPDQKLDPANSLARSSPTVSWSNVPERGAHRGATDAHRKLLIAALRSPPSWLRPARRCCSGAGFAVRRRRPEERAAGDAL